MAAGVRWLPGFARFLLSAEEKLCRKVRSKFFCSKYQALLVKSHSSDYTVEHNGHKSGGKHSFGLRLPRVLGVGGFILTSIRDDSDNDAVDNSNRGVKRKLSGI